MGITFLLAGCNLTANLENLSSPSAALEVSPKIKGGSTQDITWTYTDANFGTNPVEIAYSTDGVVWDFVESIVSHPSSGTMNVTVPLTMNTSALAWSTPAAGANGINGLTVTGTCGSLTGDGANVVLTGDISGSPVTTRS